MKKCPTCERTFEDSMRFCQSDGTPLIDDAPPLDPYKTMVARPGEFTGAGSPASSDAPIEDSKSSDDGDLLQLPNDPDPLKTMYASESEIRREMESRDAGKDQVIDLPPLAPEPSDYDDSRSNPPSFGDIPPPSSPFSEKKTDAAAGPSSESPFGKSTPSPFSDPKPSSYDPPKTDFRKYADPEPFENSASVNPFDIASPPAEWSPPPAPEPNWQQQPVGQNTPFQPPVAGTDGQNNTLSIVSLVLGILSIPCCGFLTGVPAIIVGYIARNKIASNPREFGGAGLALAGIITGAIGTIVGIIAVILQLFLGGLSAISGG